MKKFLLKIATFTLFPIGIFLGIFLLADGYTDGYYNRFRSPDQSSLILGTSRAAQAFKPSVLDSVLSRNDFFNYSFTNGHSPYGPIYFKSIKRKLDRNTSNGIFILSVNPWSISSTSPDPNDIKNFRENGLFLDNLKIVSMDPNIFYLINEYQGSYFRILLNEVEKLLGNSRPKPVYLQKNGWLDIEIPMDSTSVHQRFKNKMEDYRQNLKKYEKSETRLKTLNNLVTYLKKYGDVFLVRLPVPNAMNDIESKLYPNFDEQMKKLSNDLNISYKTYSGQGNNYTYTDGNHLYKTSAVVVSQEVALWIKSEISN